MTPLTANEYSVRAFDQVLPLAQEGTFARDALTSDAPYSPRRYRRPINKTITTFTNEQTTLYPQKVFNEIIDHAQGGSIAPSLLRAMKYGDTGGNATFTKSRFNVKPSLSDFVADVQNLARKTLTPGEMSYFMRVYFKDFLGIANVNEPLDLTPDGRDKFFAAHLEKYQPEHREHVANFDRNLRMKLGAVFLEYGLYPIREYMNSASIDVRKVLEQ